MPTELGYFTVSVKDLDRARAFYGSLFDWKCETSHAGDRYAHVNNTKRDDQGTEFSIWQPAAGY